VYLSSKGPRNVCFCLFYVPPCGRLKISRVCSCALQYLPQLLVNLLRHAPDKQNDIGCLPRSCSSDCSRNCQQILQEARFFATSWGKREWGNGLPIYKSKMQTPVVALPVGAPALFPAKERLSRDTSKNPTLLHELYFSGCLVC
jgi:hypothetical protein